MLWHLKTWTQLDSFRLWPVKNLPQDILVSLGFHDLIPKEWYIHLCGIQLGTGQKSHLEPGREAVSLPDLHRFVKDASQLSVTLSDWVFQSTVGTQETYSLCGTPSQCHSADGTVEKDLLYRPMYKILCAAGT